MPRDHTGVDRGDPGGVTMAGGIPFTFPTISLHESFAYPSSLILRNLLAMDTEEMLRALPIDAAVLVGGCDKTLPAQIMALVRDGRCYVKLSAPCRMSTQPPPWPDVGPITRALIDANARACLWGSDWPHVDIDSPVRTSDVTDALSA